METDPLSQDPVLAYEWCQRLTLRDARQAGVRERLIALLDDDRDWDCGHFPSAVAAAALARLEPAGSWIGEAIPPFRRHVENGIYVPPRAIVGAVRAVTTAEGFITWCWDALPDMLEREAGHAEVCLWWHEEWMKDDELIEALTGLGDPSTTRYVLEQLVLEEYVLGHMLRQSEGMPDVAERWRRELAGAVSRTHDVPAEIRQQVEARAREMGLLD